VVSGGGPIRGKKKRAITPGLEKAKEKRVVKSVIRGDIVKGTRQFQTKENPRGFNPSLKKADPKGLPVIRRVPVAGSGMGPEKERAKAIDGGDDPRRRGYYKTETQAQRFTRENETGTIAGTAGGKATFNCGDSQRPGTQMQMALKNVNGNHRCTQDGNPSVRDFRRQADHVGLWGGHGPGKGNRKILHKTQANQKKRQPKPECKYGKKTGSSLQSTRCAKKKKGNAESSLQTGPGRDTCNVTP